MEQTHLDEEAHDEWKKRMMVNWVSLRDAAADLAIIAHNSSLQRPYYTEAYRSIIDVAVDVACAARRCHEEEKEASDAEEDKEKTLHDLAIACHEKVLWMMMVLGEVTSCLCCECQADGLFVRYCVIQKALNAPCVSFSMGDPPPFTLDNDKPHISYGAVGVGKRRPPEPEEFILTVHAEVLAVLEALGHLLLDPYGEALRQRVSRVRQTIQTLRCPFENTAPTYSPAHSDSDSD